MWISYGHNTTGLSDYHVGGVSLYFILGTDEVVAPTSLGNARFTISSKTAVVDEILKLGYDNSYIHTQYWGHVYSSDAHELCVQ